MVSTIEDTDSLDPGLGLPVLPRLRGGDPHDLAGLVIHNDISVHPQLTNFGYCFCHGNRIDDSNDTYIFTVSPERDDPMDERIPGIQDRRRP